MKPFRHTVLILSLLLSAGCSLVYDDLSECPPAENVTLLFTRMVAGSDEFRNNVQTVDVVVFDERGYFVTRKTVAQADMEAFRTSRADQISGTRLRLAPGTYRIVCWGNAGDNTTYQNFTASHTIADALLQHTACDSGTGETYDPLYYAPRMGSMATPEIFTIAVPEHGVQTGTIDFTAAHNTVEVYIKGFSSTAGPATDLPEVEITRMSWGYDFLMNTQNGRPLCFVQNAQHVAIANDMLPRVRFHTAHFENDNPILIHIKDPYTHESIYTVNLKKFLADNHITLNPTDHDLIRVMLEFIGADVKLTVPNWSGTDIKPGF